MAVFHFFFASVHALSLFQYAHPIASSVMILLSISNMVSNSGIAVISFVLLSTAVCPSTNWCWQLHALTVCNALFRSFVVNERRAVFPSMAMISVPVVSIRDDIHD